MDRIAVKEQKAGKPLHFEVACLLLHLTVSFFLPDNPEEPY